VSVGSYIKAQYTDFHVEKYSMVDVSTHDNDSTSNLLHVDPFWYSIYRPILLKGLGKRWADKGSTGLSREWPIDKYIVEGLAIFKTASRSEAQLFLMNVKCEFGDRDGMDNFTQNTFKYLMGVLHDITGKQKVRDLQFFRDLRDTFYRCKEHTLQELDRYIFNKLFFIHIENFVSIEQDYSISHLCDTNATFSSHAIKRFYHDTKWSLMGSITMCSRLALSYRFEDPLNMMGEIKHKEPSHHMVAPRETSIAHQLDSLLKPFARPLPVDVKYVYIRQSDFPDIRIDTLKHIENMDGWESNVVTTSEVPIGLTRRTIQDEDTRQRSKLKRFPEIEERIIGVEIDTKSVSNQNIYICISEWLTRPLLGLFKNACYTMRWIIPGLPMAFSYRPNSFVEARLTKGSTGKIQFLPMGPIIETDRCIALNRRTLDHLTQHITERVCFAIGMHM
jgi:hypothetical protein